MEKYHEMTEAELDALMARADYTGVPTHELAQLIRWGGVGTPGNEYKSFAERVKIGYNVDGSPKYLEDRWIYRIIYEEVPWVSLHIADCICMALGRNVSKDLTIIPAGYANSALKMAADEFWLAEVSPTKAELRWRAGELQILREMKITEGILLKLAREDD